MLVHLNYQVDKEALRKAFFDRYDQGDWHRKGDNEVFGFWWKVFGIEELVAPITKDLGLDTLDNKPRFSYQLPQSTLDNHIDPYNAVGINFNLFDESAFINMNGVQHRYESALIDVGHRVHGVLNNTDSPRLVLKYAVYNQSWDEVYSMLDKRGLVNHEKTAKFNPSYKSYKSYIVEGDDIYIGHKINNNVKKEDRIQPTDMWKIDR